MYSVSEDYVNAASSPSRKALVKVRFNGTTEVDAACIKKITITETLTANSNLSIGDACSNMAVLEMFMPKIPIDLDNSTFEVSVGLKTVEIPQGDTAEESIWEYCPMGKFYVTEVETEDNYKTVKITAYDAMSRMNVAYEPLSVTAFPASIRDVAEDIASKNNMSVVTDYFPEYRIGFMECTEREMVGYIAGLLGCNAAIDREGNLDFRWYKEKDFLLDSDIQYMNGFKHTATGEFKLEALISGTEEKVIDEGTGNAITFYNPYMTENILKSIYEELPVTKFLPCEVKYRCNPAIECGDIITVMDKDLTERKEAVMAQIIEIAGGRP